MQLHLCQYVPNYKQDCLEIFDSNTPKYFAHEERREFADFLENQNPPYYYFVVKEQLGGIVGCGGIKFDLERQVAKLRWDMVQFQHHREGIGSFLTQNRLAIIRQSPEVKQVLLGTSQYSYPFYEKMGFRIYQITEDGIAPGFDEYVMKIELCYAKRQR